MCLQCGQLLWSMEVLELESYDPGQVAVQHHCKDLSANKNKSLITQLPSLKRELSSEQWKRDPSGSIKPP